MSGGRECDNGVLGHSASNSIVFAYVWNLYFSKFHVRQSPKQIDSSSSGFKRRLRGTLQQFGSNADFVGDPLCRGDLCSLAFVLVFLVASKVLQTATHQPHTKSVVSLFAGGHSLVVVFVFGFRVSGVLAGRNDSLRFVHRTMPDLVLHRRPSGRPAAGVAPSVFALYASSSLLVCLGASRRLAEVRCGQCPWARQGCALSSVLLCFFVLATCI